MQVRFSRNGISNHTSLLVQPIKIPMQGPNSILIGRKLLDKQETVECNLDRWSSNGKYCEKGIQNRTKPILIAVCGNHTLLG